MRNKYFEIGFIFLLLLTSCNNGNNKIKLYKNYDAFTEKCDIKVDLPELDEKVKCYVFYEKNYTFEYDCDYLEGYEIIKEIINISEFYTTGLSNGGNHTTGLGYKFNNGFKVFFNQWKILESSKYYTDRYMYWIKTSELDKNTEPVEYKGVYKSEKLFYKFFEFHEKALNNSYNETFNDSGYGF